MLPSPKTYGSSSMHAGIILASKNKTYCNCSCSNNFTDLALIEPEISKWKVNSDGQDERQLKYTMPVNNPMGECCNTKVMIIENISCSHL